MTGLPALLPLLGGLMGCAGSGGSDAEPDGPGDTASDTAGMVDDTADTDTAGDTAEAPVQIACAFTTILTGGLEVDLDWAASVEDGVVCDGAGDATAASIMFEPEASLRIVVGWTDGGLGLGTFPGTVGIARASNELWGSNLDTCEVEILTLDAIDSARLPRWAVTGAGRCVDPIPPLVTNNPPVGVGPFTFAGVVLREG